MTLLAAFASGACSSWHKKDFPDHENIRWDGKSHLSLGSESCRAKFRISVDDGNGSWEADAQWRFQLKRDRSELELQILGAFHSPAAILKISPNKQYWLNSTGEMKSLAENHGFMLWFTPSWWQEVAFFFGRLTKDSSHFIWLNRNLQPEFFVENHRKIRCEYEENTSLYPSSCELRDRRLVVKLYFSFAECRSPL